MIMKSMLGKRQFSPCLQIRRSGVMVLTLLMVLGGFGGPVQAALVDGRIRLALVADSQVDSQAMKEFATRLETALVQSGRFELVGRGEELEALREEIALGQSPDFDPKEAVPSRKLKAAPYLLVVKLTEAHVKEKSVLGGAVVGGVGVHTQIATVRVDYRLMLTATGDIFQADTAVGEHKTRGAAVLVGPVGGLVFGQEGEETQLGKAAQGALGKLMASLIQHFNRQGMILAVAGSSIIVDLGSAAGLRPGMTLMIQRTTPIKSGEGEVVYVDRELIGKATVEDVALRRLKATWSGETPKEGDMALVND